MSRYRIDPFQGLNKRVLFFFNTLLRLTGWLANQIVRYLLRLVAHRALRRAGATISKRDFHQNHYLLTKQLLRLLQITSEKYHPIPDDYLEKLNKAHPDVGDLCRLVILLGYILDGQLSWRERFKLRDLNRAGILKESYADLKRYAREFLNGAGVGTWGKQYLSERS